MISKGLILGIIAIIARCSFTYHNNVNVIKEIISKGLKLTPAINPPITRRIMLFPENTESVYLLHALAMFSK